MKILGIDPGTASTGYGIIKQQNKNETQLTEYGTITTDSDKKPSQRLKKIFNQLNQIIRQEKIQELAVEDLFFSKNKKTAKKVFQARGVILLTASKNEIPVFNYNPQKIKKALTGYGKADKKQVQKMVQATLELDTLPRPDHAADAIACALCHKRIKNSNHPEFN